MFALRCLRLRFPLAAMCGWLLCQATVAGAAPTSLAACEALVRSDPTRASICYPAVVRSGDATLEAVTRRLAYRVARHPDQPQIRFALALLLAMAGDASAEGEFRSVAATFTERGNSTGEVLSRTALANFLMRRGRLSDALEVLTEADRSAAASSDPVLVARVRIMQGWAAYRQADYGRAMRALKEVEPTALASTDAVLKAAWLSAYGANLWAVGRTEEALATYREEVGLHRASGNRYDEATALSNVALLSSGSDRQQRALETARVAREAGNVLTEASAYFYLSESAPPAEARAYAQRSLDLARSVHATEAISRAQGVLAMRTLPFDAAAAFALIDRAIEDARGVGDPNQAVRHRFTKANMRWIAGPREQAIADSNALLDAIERLRSFQPEADVRAARFSQWRWAYYRLAGHLLAGHLDAADAAPDHALAFHTLERMRSRMLLDRLDAAGARLPAKANPLRAERERLLRDIAAVNRRLGGLTDGPEKLTALRELEELEARVADAAAALARADPAFGLVHVPQLAALDDVRAALHGDEALLTYQLAPLVDEAGNSYGGWIWIVTRSEARTIPLPDPDHLDAAVDLFNGLINRADHSENVAAARLYTLLMQPALETLGSPVSKLIVIPDGTLHRLPFDALRPTPSAAPLGATMQITLAPSATTWLRWRESHVPPAAVPVLVLADPTLPAAARASGTMRDSNSGLAPLPEARGEGLALVRALGGGSRMFAGDAATESAIKRASLETYGVLHFAAHAIIDDLHPERSAVVLAPGDAGEDGYLQAREIAELHLTGQLVLLSSCRSAGGSLIAGEGVLGLAHAFFRAGARTVVGTLWPIRDDHAREAFELIGRQLGQGASVGAAVTSARATLIGRGAPAAAWGSLVVMGDGEFVPLPGGRRWEPDLALFGAVGCTAIAVIAFTVRVRARKTAMRRAISPAST